MQRQTGGREPEEERPMLAGFQRTRTRTRMRYTGHRRPPPPKTTLAAVTMLVIGTVMAMLGASHVWNGDSSRGGHHLLIGGIRYLSEGIIDVEKADLQSRSDRSVSDSLFRVRARTIWWMKRTKGQPGKSNLPSFSSTKLLLSPETASLTPNDPTSTCKSACSTTSMMAFKEVPETAVLLPGSYASFNLLGAYLGWPGYDYDSIPSYDD